MEKDYIKLYDQACKRLLVKKPVIALLCKYTIEELKDYSLEEIETLFNDINTGDNRELDNRMLDYKSTVTLHNGKRLIINVEIQNDEYPGYNLYNRALFYSSLLITTQERVEFEGNHYNDIRKVYSIWILPHSSIHEDGLITETKQTTRSLTCDYPLKQINKQTIIMIHVSDQHDHNIPYEYYDTLLTPLLLLFTGRYSYKESTQILKERYGIDGFETEAEEMCNLGEGLARRYERQGIQQGLQQDKIENLKLVMKKLNYSFKQACDLLDVDSSLRPMYKELVEEN